MPLFKCRFSDDSGRLVEKEIEASDAEALKKSLENDGQLVYEISEKGKLFAPQNSFINKSRIKSSEFLVFNQEFAALLRAGLPILTSLETLAEKEENRFMKDVLSSVASDLKEGTSLSDAINKYPNIFKKLYVASIKAGEKSGDIVANILRYITYIRKVEELKKKVFDASVYPIILLSVAVVVVFFLLFYVVPSFSKIFIDSGTALPLPTMILIAGTDLIKNNMTIIFVGLAIVIPLLILVKNSGRFDHTFNQISISLPWIGIVIKKYAIAKFCRTLATILKSGEPLVSAMLLAVGTLDNTYMEKKIREASQEVMEGESLANAVGKTGFMPATALKMISVGESSGSLEDMFENVAELFEDEVDRRLSVVTSVVEPMLMLIMGLVVAFIVVAMYLPIFKIAGAVR